ncbi:MAG: RNA polymerase sigma factor [Bacteroidota bacterium]
MENATDTQILSFVQNPAHVEKGFRLLLATYQERLYWHIRKLVIEHEDANDVLQNVLIKVYRNIQKFEGKAQLFTWLYRIATNESLTFLTRKKKKLAISLDEEVSQVGANLVADTYFEGSQIQIKLQQAILQLPEKQKLVFVMRYFEGLSYEAISEILATSKGGLKASYHHAVKKIEKFIKAND